MHAATHCTTLHHTTTGGVDGFTSILTACKTLKHTATHCNTLQHTATGCVFILIHTATHCNTLLLVV